MGLYSNELLELAIINHLLDDVEATHEFSLDDELRECRPVIVDLQAWLLQNVRYGGAI